MLDEIGTDVIAGALAVRYHGVDAEMLAAAIRPQGVCVTGGVCGVGECMQDGGVVSA